jgi:hypothetical protein
MEDRLEPGDIVQITNSEHKWFPCLIIVSEIKSFGIQGYITVPKNDGSGGNAYTRLNNREFEKVGRALLVASHGTDY